MLNNNFHKVIQMIGIDISYRQEISRPLHSRKHILTEISLAAIRLMAWTSNYILTKQWDLLTYPLISVTTREINTNFFET